MDHDQPHPRPADQPSNSGAGVLTSYAELVRILESLPLLVEHKRRLEQLSLRAAGDASGVDYSSLNRCEKGEKVGGDIQLALLRWVGGLPPATTPPRGGANDDRAGNQNRN